jgi:hypothetical protein
MVESFLSIPSQDEQFKIRFRIIKHQKILTLSEFEQFKKSFQARDRGGLQEILQIASAQINEIDHLAMGLSYLFMQDMLPDRIVKTFSTSLRQLSRINQVLQNKECFQISNEDFNQARLELKALGKKIGDEAFLRVRTKLALLELCAVVLREPIFLKLISITPLYFADAIIQKWLFDLKYHSEYGTPTMSRNARKNFKLIHKAIEGDKRKKKREYSYWQIHSQVNELVAYCEGFKKLKNHKEAVADFKLFCKIWKIPTCYQSIIKNPPSRYRKFKTLVLDILCEQGILEDRKTYDNVILPHIQKLEEQYRPLILLLQPFLDLTTRNPDVLSSIPYLTPLKSIKI